MLNLAGLVQRRRANGCGYTRRKNARHGNRLFSQKTAPRDEETGETVQSVRAASHNLLVQNINRMEEKGVRLTSGVSWEVRWTGSTKAGDPEPTEAQIKREETLSKAEFEVSRASSIRGPRLRC